MIPILFAATETDFTHNGIGRLVDTISAEVTEQRNGIYELELTYPITGRLYKQLLNGGIIAVIHDDNHDIQPFDIYKTSAEIEGVVTVNAHHISYRLNNIILEPYTASSASAAVAGISTHSANTNPFTFSTDKNVNALFNLQRPASVRSILWGQEGSLLDSFGTAEFKFDKWNVQMLLHRGSDTGVTVRYGKNLTEIEWEHDSSGTCNALAPYWTDGNEYVYLPEIIVQPTTPISPVKPAPLDMSDKFAQKPTEAQLRTAAIAYLDANSPWESSDTIKIDMIAMWQSPEYENVASIQRVGLCDTVSIYHTDMGIVSEKAEIVRVVYDVLAERFSEIEVGTVSTSYVAIENGQNAADYEMAKINGAINVAMCYQNGDTVTIENYVPLAAYVTASTKVLRIAVPVQKSLANISSVTVDSIVGGCRGVSGNLNSLSGDSNDFSQIGTVTADIASDNLVIITITSTNAYTNVSNNTPLAFSAKDITLTFSGSGGGGRSAVNIVQDPGTGSLYIS